MINLARKEECCGCSACAAVCPTKCITMRADAEGFLYPTVNEAACVDCHLCEKKCPVNGRTAVMARTGVDKAVVIRDAISAESELPDCYVCFSKDDNTRENSTSGGVFSVIANPMLQQGGIVYGVAFGKNHEVIHTSAETLAELSTLRRSKYVQSNQTGVYSSIRSALEAGRHVLYTGTPCQVSGLKACLGKEYEKLIAIDIFCHGVGSPLYWQKYVDYMEKAYRSPAREIRFREKTYGYNSATLAVYFENGKKSQKGHDDDLYWSAFSKNYIFRPSCYECAFKTVKHESDFSIGDFWNAGDLPAEFGRAEGCSLVLCHSDKAKKLFEDLKDTMMCHAYDLERALVINGGHQPSMLITSPVRPEKREQFFADMNSLTPLELNRKYLPLSAKKKLKCFAKPMLHKLGLLSLLKKLQRS